MIASPTRIVPDLLSQRRPRHRGAREDWAFASAIRAVSQHGHWGTKCTPRHRATPGTFIVRIEKPCRASLAARPDRTCIEIVQRHGALLLWMSAAAKYAIWSSLAFVNAGREQTRSTWTGAREIDRTHGVSGREAHPPSAGLQQQSGYPPATLVQRAPHRDG